LLRALRDEKYAQPTEIQARAIPPLLEGRDLLGCARTGTGKTAAFVLPILQRLAASKRPLRRTTARALILVPTRELAAQVHLSSRTYGRHLNLSTALVYGGVGQGPQVRALTRGVEILVATPGRLLDLLEQGHLSLAAVEIVVLDEADQMLDLGFLPAMKRILAAVPARRHTLLFSATMPPAIATLAEKILSNPVRIVVAQVASTVDEVDQRVHFVEPGAKADLLAEVLADGSAHRTLVFTRTKRGADRLVKVLRARGLRAEAIHGNKSQGTRERALEGFRHGHRVVLVATDIAARGIDVDGITHVVNYELPNVPETYVHRIGRTARAGATGTAISFCAPDEREFLRDIERLIRRPLRVIGATPRAPQHAHANERARTPHTAHRAQDPRRQRGNRGGHPRHATPVRPQRETRPAPHSRSTPSLPFGSGTES
jgi:ATP-dependent RNA helicase RhlE